MPHDREPSASSMESSAPDAKRRGVEFWKGALLPFPVFLALALLAWSVLDQSAWSAIGATGDVPLEILVAACVLTVVGLVALAARTWNRSRWFAYGVLASFVVGFVLGGALAVLMMIAVGGAMKG